VRHRYDPVADALYIYLTDEIVPGGAVESRISDLALKSAHIAYDFDHEGLILGIEIVGVSRVFTPAGIALLSARDEI
jgi:uncharacterized protein YuzE